jgi:hypothetical protein
MLSIIAGIMRSITNGPAMLKLLSLFWILALCLAGCDRLEGKARDTGAAMQNLLVSDMQRNAEALCSKAITGWRTPEHTGAAGKFEPSEGPPRVRVYGDGKYKVTFELDRTDGAQPVRTYRGECSVENDSLVEAKVFSN